MGFFKKLFGKSMDELSAPVAGNAVPVSQVPDPTFAEELLGKGIAIEPTEGNLVIFDEDLDMDHLRMLVNGAVPKCGGMVAAFIGSDEEGYRYIIGSANVDLRAKGKEINAAIKGKGGGKSEMMQGTATASAAEIKAYFE